MSERQRLLKRLQVCEFTLDDVRLYLDSHPCDRSALEYYKKHLEMRNKAYQDYIEKFGPLMANDCINTEKWTWVEEPWPWEKEA